MIGFWLQKFIINNLQAFYTLIQILRNTKANKFKCPNFTFLGEIFFKDFLFRSGNWMTTGEEEINFGFPIAKVFSKNDKSSK